MSDTPSARRSLTVVYNPVKVDDLVAAQELVAKAAVRHGWEDPSWIETTKDETGEKQGREAVRAGSDVVASLGGDGTVRAVAVGWLCVHTVYVLRYARVYYASPRPPIDFNQDEDPTFSDFAYFSFNLGMAYQVSDTDLRSSAVRRVVLGHTLLAYLYGTIVIAATINLVAGIGGSLG
jgi:hypothetical protein